MSSRLTLIGHVQSHWDLGGLFLVKVLFLCGIHRKSYMGNSTTQLNLTLNDIIDRSNWRPLGFWNSVAYARNASGHTLQWERHVHPHPYRVFRKGGLLEHTCTSLLNTDRKFYDENLDVPLDLILCDNSDCSHILKAGKGNELGHRSLLNTNRKSHGGDLGVSPRDHLVHFSQHFWNRTFCNVFNSHTCCWPQAQHKSPWTSC